MRAGSLNSRIELLINAGERDAANELTNKWVRYGSPNWASIRHTSGIQAIKAGAERQIVKASIRLRFRRDVVAGMRVHHREDFYEIEAVLADEVKRDHVDLVCRLLSPMEVAA